MQARFLALHAEGQARRGGYSGPSQCPPQWLDLWAFAVYDLGIRPGDFWRLTLAEFEALSRRHALAGRQAWDIPNWWGSIIATQQVNLTWRGKGAKMAKPQEFLPGPAGVSRVAVILAIAQAAAPTAVVWSLSAAVPQPGSAPSLSVSVIVAPPASSCV